jgi:lipid II:glycine glycyltransferase (peptidoglycan interpeptide bridge formation enzyme)
MEVLLAHKEGQLCAGLIYSAIGDTAIYLFGATNRIALETSAAYLLQWEAVKRLKERGVRAYDLNGIDPALNPGVYQFKTRLAGPRGREVTFVGQLQASGRSPISRFLLLLERIRHRVRTSRSGGRPPEREVKAGDAAGS